MHAPLCAPGAQTACYCPGGGDGVQVCSADGSGYEACQCADDVPGAGGGPWSSWDEAGGSASAGGGFAPGSDGPAAGSGGSGVACQDDCSGEPRCVDASTLQQCGDFDDDACLDYGAPVPCPGGCADGACVTDCVGPAAESCGNCGERTRTCDGGVWSAWSSCSGEGACAPGDVQNCHGGTQTCDSSCVWGACIATCGDDDYGQFSIRGRSCSDPSNSDTCDFGPAGCAGDGSMPLKLAAAMISPTTIRFFVRKQDDSAWLSPATLTVYVGTGPTCSPSVVPNVVKTTAPATVGQRTQTIDLSLNPYSGAWPLDETKIFWVGKSESGFPCFRATGTVSVQKICEP
ncbi:hypothetical protein WMF28_21770 [Sorangium sp. So ce590]|uniref:hypothetical protein n=1 Tax=Sorangium sp. So ce590 TaxID=3133317 RepID=UPI003F616AAD